MRKHWVLVLFVASVLAPLTVRGEEAFASGRVVLLSGLPGDVESDRAYQRDLDSILDVLGAVSPKDVTILMHDPAHHVLPEKWKEATVLPATEENFLALGQKLGAASEPISLIAWGHGGLVRGEPVFHVSGLRITRADFQAFASAGAPLRAILYFVGSGDIGRTLAGKNREIVTSENGTRFTSDPAGLEALIASWKKQPAASLGEIGRAAGPQIASLYTSRQLARTEEPTLFSEGEPPVLLADLAPGTPTAQTGSEAPENWRKIARVEAKDYPGSDAVVLDRKIKYTLGENPAVDEEIDEYVQILTAEGKRRGDFDLTFSPPSEDLIFVSLEVLTAAGKVESFDPENVLEQKSTEVEGYQAGGRKAFSLPHVEAGSIIHAHYRRVWKRFPFPSVFLNVPVVDDIPIRRSSVEIETARGKTLHTHLTGGLTGEPQVAETSYGQVSRWGWKDLSAYANEILAEPGGAPELQVSTFPDWKSFGDWYQRLIREADTITDAIRQQTDEVIAGRKTPEEKVKALYEFVAGMRYISIPLGVNSYRPHAADHVLGNRYGDCKDKANLLNTMLRAAGFQAQLVLVPRFSQADASVPGLAFNHAISRVELPSGPMWLDATDDVCPFGMLPPGDAGRNVLVVGGDNTLSRLPDPAAQDHWMSVELLVDPARDFAGQAHVAARGFPGYSLRAASRLSDATNGTQPFLDGAGLFAASGIFVAGTESHTPASVLDGDFKWQAEGRWAGLTGPARDGHWTFAPPFVLPQTWRYALQKRSRELFLNHGYPLVLDESLRIKGGAKDLPALREQTEGPLRWRLTWKQEGDSVVGKLHVELPQGRIAPEETALFQQEVGQLSEALATPITVAAGK